VNQISGLALPVVAALLARKGEGLEFLAQLGVDMEPTLTGDERARVMEAISTAESDVARNDAEDLRDVAVAIDQANWRLTLVADLPERRSLVAFVAPDAVAVLLLIDDAFLASLITLDDLEIALSQVVSSAAQVGVGWSLARWAADVREITVVGSDHGIFISGVDAGTPEKAKASESLVELVALAASR
jgi:hypothetical protein